MALTGNVNHNLAQEHGAEGGRSVANSGVYNRAGTTPKPFNGDNRAARGFDSSRKAVALIEPRTENAVRIPVLSAAIITAAKAAAFADRWRAKFVVAEAVAIAAAEAASYTGNPI